MWYFTTCAHSNRFQDQLKTTLTDAREAYCVTQVVVIKLLGNSNWKKTMIVVLKFYEFTML